jgi:uncharacterized damage-inducible protein DinB
MYSDNIAYAFGTAQFTIDANLSGVTHEESLKAPSGGGNCMNWIAGHILSSRDIVLKQLGSEPVLPENDSIPYQRGAGGLKPEHRCVILERLQEGLKKSSEILLEKLNGLSDDDLSQALDPSAFPMPVEKPTKGLLLTLFLFHESYHAGQLGVCRRVLGKEGILK